MKKCKTSDLHRKILVYKYEPLLFLTEGENLSKDICFLGNFLNRNVLFLFQVTRIKHF